MLRLYVALLDVQEPAGGAARDDRPAPSEAADYIAEHVWPAVVAATIAAGPPALAAAVRRPVASPAEAVAAWLAGESQPAVPEYLARAASAPVLETLGAAALVPPPSPRRGACPRCGGPPQLSYLAASGETLLTTPRRLLCARCGGSWIHEWLGCPACGEHASAKRPRFADDERLPALSVDACESCRRYLIAVDGRRDEAAVPVVDELVALPLDLDARERGFTKIAPNLMGI
ncbi:MAG TPA: formate dehydrogenase accessory protein FdhE [Methylomirabilota bacterium]